jgi:hypothetical protein
LLHQSSKQHDLGDKEETKMNAKARMRAVPFLAIMPVVLTAQVMRNPDPVVLKHWAAPLYWQPRAADAASQALDPNPLVFVAMTPCRLVDTRASQGFPPAFGPPSLVAGASRTFPVRSSASCPIPSAAQAYSFNITVVPAGPSGFITAYATGQPVPLAATLVWSGGSLTSNAAIVPGGTSGSVDVFSNGPTDIVIDINGYYASLTDLAANTAVGAGALQNNTTGSGNTATGASALLNNTTGNANTASGTFALFSNTTGGANTASGYGVLDSNTTGFNNTASGEYALNSNTTGANNTASGVEALLSNTTGSDNTASGVGALLNNTTGNSNIAIGENAGYNVSGGSYNIHIGARGVPGDNGTIRIGTLLIGLGQTSFFAAGIRGVTTGINNAVPVVIDSDGQLGTTSSSRRYKEDIQDMGDASRGLMQLRPVTFRYQKPFADGTKPVQYGLIAEEVADVFPDLVARSSDGQIETVKYQLLDSLLLNELQREARQVQQQADTIRLLESRIAALELSSKATTLTSAGQ